MLEAKFANDPQIPTQNQEQMGPGIQEWTT